MQTIDQFMDTKFQNSIRKIEIRAILKRASFGKRDALAQASQLGRDLNGDDRASLYSAVEALLADAPTDNVIETNQV